ncbi:hypothetical protein ABPG75_008685 [Micractinium tetrahymenae]
MLSQRAAGTLVLVTSCSLYSYYTFWVLITPFIEEDQPVLRLFPPRYYAIAVPVLAGVALFGTTLLTLGCFLVSSELRKYREEWAGQGRSKNE